MGYKTLWERGTSGGPFSYYYSMAWARKSGGACTKRQHGTNIIAMIGGGPPQFAAPYSLPPSHDTPFPFPFKWAFALFRRDSFYLSPWGVKTLSRNSAAFLGLERRGFRHKRGVSSKLVEPSCMGCPRYLDESWSVPHLERGTVWQIWMTLRSSHVWSFPNNLPWW